MNSKKPILLATLLTAGLIVLLLVGSVHAPPVITQLTFNTKYDADPSISGDGSKIAFHSDVDGDYEIFVINSDGTGLAQLTSNNARDIGTSISDDGSKIAFMSDVDGDEEIFLWQAEEIHACIDIDPDALNLESKGQWITAYIQLPEGYEAEDIDATTILLNETVSPVLDPKYEFVTNPSEYLIDHNEDGILERMVKFDRAEVMALLSVGEATLTITGEVDGTPFEGTDTVKVLFPGDVDDDGDCDRYDYGLFAEAYGTSVDDAAYVLFADFNEDQNIDRYDYGILAEYYGETAV